MDTIQDRILSKVEHAANGCWVWKKATQTNGYGSIGINGRSTLAHRASYEAFVGPIPEGMTIDHRCHSDATDCAGGKTCQHRLCVNPAHLEPVTQAENNARGLSPFATNARRTQCVNGHALDERNTYMKAGRRQCRACANERNRQWRARRAESSERAA